MVTPKAIHDQYHCCKKPLKIPSVKIAFRMKGVLKLGSISGIKIEVHWTYTLFLIWVAFLEIHQGTNFDIILLNEALIVVLFVCVMLHEMGHALIAKKFKINTQKIMLRPIGGVATL